MTLQDSEERGKSHRDAQNDADNAQNGQCVAELQFSSPLSLATKASARMTLGSCARR